MSQFRALPLQFKPQTLRGMKLEEQLDIEGICGILETYGSTYPNPFYGFAFLKSDLGGYPND